MTQDLIDRADANYFDSWRIMAGRAPGASYREGDGLLAVHSGTAVAWLNAAYVMRPLPEPQRQIAEAVAWFDALGVPCVVRVRAGVDPAAERACEALGLPYSDSVPGMILEEPQRVEARAVAGLRIREAAGGDLPDVARINAEAFGLPLESCARLLSAGLIQEPDVTVFVGDVDGAIAATSASVVTRRVAGVYFVATASTHRGRGIGDAMTAHAVRAGVGRGAIAGSLQASEMGKPIYERMGFSVAQEYRTFHRPGV